MTNLRRYFQPNNTCFLTHVTYNRNPILVENADLLREAMDRYLVNGSCELIAWAILPDHCHLLLNTGNEDISTLMKRLKLSFSTSYRRRIGVKKGRVWQYRFWDHIIRNVDDMQAHCDYIHFNPTKHGLVKSPFEWEHSSARDYLQAGYYSDDWSIDPQVSLGTEFGE